MSKDDIKTTVPLEWHTLGQPTKILTYLEFLKSKEARCKQADKRDEDKK